MAHERVLSLKIVFQLNIHIVTPLCQAVILRSTAAEIGSELLSQAWTRGT